MGRKGGLSWVSYKVYLTETCDEQAPCLIAHVSSLVATSPDETIPWVLHTDLQQVDQQPSQHLVDAGYITVQALVESRRTFGVELVGETRSGDKLRKGISAGFIADDFTLDW